MTPSLHDFQAAMVRETDAAFRAGARAVLNVAPTGAGKGELIAYWLRRCVDAGRRVLFLVHLGEIVADARARAVKHGVPDAAIRTIVGGKVDGHSGAPITLTSWQSAHARTLTVDVDLVMVDEAHRSKARTNLATLGRHATVRLLGFTATAQRGDGSGLGDAGFDAIVAGPQIRELVAAGRLAPVRLIAPDDYVDALAWEPADAWARWAPPGAAGLVFASSLAHSRAIAAELQGRGVRAVHVDADVPKRDREAAVEGLGSGAVDVLCCFRLFTDGINVPRASVVMLATAFSHDGPYLQSIGRGRRVCDGKARCTVLDLRGNRWRRSHPDAERIYSLTGLGCTSVLEPLPACRQCPECLAWVDGARCPDCGALSPNATKPARVRRVELHEQTTAREAARIARQDGLARTGADWDLFVKLVAESHAKGKAHVAAFRFKLARGRPPRWRVAHALEHLGLAQVGEPHSAGGMR